jgi:hypothetical protein
MQFFVDDKRYGGSKPDHLFLNGVFFFTPTTVVMGYGAKDVIILLVA